MGRDQIINDEFSAFSAQLSLITRFIDENPEFLSKNRRGASREVPFGSDEWWRRWAGRFISGRSLNPPSKPKTKSDPRVRQILKSYFGIEEGSLDAAIKNHSDSMAAENVIGSLLEAYLATHLEPKGWIWCSGETVKSIDFLKVDDEGLFHPIQVKNKSNSENSSSASVRNGTNIEKWHRLNAVSGKTRWDKFPDRTLVGVISESGFEQYVAHYLTSEVCQ